MFYRTPRGNLRTTTVAKSSSSSSMNAARPSATRWADDASLSRDYLAGTMKPSDRPGPRRLALLIAFLVLLVAIIVVWQSRSPSTPASTVAGTPTLDASAWPEIHVEPVASTELTWDPRTESDPGADVVISAKGDLFASQLRDWNIVVIDEAGHIVRTIGREGRALVGLSGNDNIAKLAITQDQVPTTGLSAATIPVVRRLPTAIR